MNHETILATATNFTAQLAQEPTLQLAAAELHKFDGWFNFHAQTLWTYLLNNVGEFGLFTWFFWCSLVAIELLGGGFFLLLDATHLFDRFKIQPKKLPDQASYSHCLKRLLFIYCVLLFPLSFSHSFLLKDILGVSAVDPVPSLSVILPQLLVFLFCEDAGHYFLHRALHTPYLYKKIHKVHHRHTAPFGFSAAYAHPIEVFLLAAPTYSGLLFVRPHLFTFILWIFTRQLDSLDTHCGFEFPWHPHRFVPYWGGAPFHDYHHAAFNWNFASRFTYLDKIFGTYKEGTESQKLE